jgi:hypothetical protein
MSGSNEKNKGTPPPAPAPGYSQEFPRTAPERERAKPDTLKEAAEQQKGPDPRDAEAPFGGGTFNGTDDPSRFSTPPAKKS